MTLETSTSCTPRRWTPGSFLRQKALDPLDEDDPLDSLWEQDFYDGEDVDDEEKSEILEVHEDKDKAHALRGEKHHCDVDGLLRLNGTINVEKERIYMNCRRVVAQEGVFNLSAPLHFSVPCQLVSLFVQRLWTKHLGVGLQGARCTICL